MPTVSELLCITHSGYQCRRYQRPDTAKLLQPLKSQGVNRMDDSALIIRCKFTAVPGQQFVLRREAFTRIQKAFEENGIQFAPRRVLVEATSPQEAVKAAAGAIDQEAPAGQKPADEP